MQDQGAIAHLEKAPLGQLIAATRRRVKQALWARLVPHGLTPQQYWMLMVLMEHGPHSLHELAVRVSIDDPTACRIVKALCGRKLLVSGPDPRHGRRILIRLAPGTEELQEALKGVAGNIRRAVELNLEAEEKAAMRRGLLQVIANMDTLDEAPAAIARRA